MANDQLLASFLVLSVIGISISSYLIRKRAKKQPLVCPGLHDCTKVTESKYNHIFGVKNDVLGLLFFVSALVGIIITLVVPAYEQLIFLAIAIASGAAMLSTFILIYIQIYKIKDYCLYCLAASITILLMFINSLLLYFDVFA